MIRDELKTRREKIKAISAKEKARKPSGAKRAAMPKAAAAEIAAPVVAAPNRRSRKHAEVSAAD